MHHRDESGDDFSYTPPESGSVVSSEAATPTLSTPRATPPQSPLLEHTPDISGTNDLSLHEDVATPAATPPLSQTEEIEETSLATPQVWATVVMQTCAYICTMYYQYSHCVMTTISYCRLQRRISRSSLSWSCIQRVAHPCIILRMQCAHHQQQPHLIQSVWALSLVHRTH